MTPPSRAQLGRADTVTVYVFASDGALVDVIEDVDLGDPLEASRNGRTSLKEAALWAGYAADCYRRSQPPGASLMADRGCAAEPEAGA